MFRLTILALAFLAPSFVLGTDAPTGGYLGVGLKANDDEWVGDTVFPKRPDLELEDENGKKTGLIWTSGIVLSSKKDRLEIKTKTYRSRTREFVRKDDVVRLDDAAQFFSAMIRVDDKDYWAIQSRASVWEKKGELENAVKDCTEMIRLRPTAMSYLHRGGAYLTKGEPETALKDFTEVLRLAKADDEDTRALAYSGRGIAYLKLKKHDEAISAFTECLRINPDQSGPMQNRGLAWMNKGEYDKALGDFAASLRMRPSGSAYSNRSKLWILKKEYDKAVEDASEAIKLDPSDSLAYYHRGMGWQAKSEYKKALADYEKSLRLDPKNQYVLQNRGNVYSALKDFAKASEDFTAALGLDPDNAALLGLRGEAWMKLGKYDDAVKDYSAVLRINPKDGTTYFRRANAYRLSGRLDDAIGDYDSCIRLVPKANVAMYYRAALRASMGEHSKAIADYESAIGIDSNHVNSLNGLAWLLATCPEAKFRDGNRAVELATKACELTKWKETYYFDTLAAAHAEAGDFEQAVSHQKKAIDGLAKDDKDADEYRERLKLYEMKKPYRDLPKKK